MFTTLANPKLRPSVLVGDGAFQMTGMELSTAARYGLNPARTAFTDDNADNIAAAEQLGVRAIRFGDPGQLRRELRALGLPV